MKKKALLLLVTIAIAVVTLAQTETKTKTKTNVSIGPTFGKVSGNISDTHSGTYGFIGQVILTPAGDFSYTITTGCLTYNGKDGVENLTQLPLLVGFRYHFDICYAGISSGIAFFDNNYGNQFTYNLVTGFKLSKMISLDGRYLLSGKEHKNISSFNVTLAFCL